VSREKRNPLCFSENLNNPDRALECFEQIEITGASNNEFFLGGTEDG